MKAMILERAIMYDGKDGHDGKREKGDEREMDRWYLWGDASGKVSSYGRERHG